MRKLTNIIKLGIYAAKCVFRDEGIVIRLINRLIKITRTKIMRKQIQTILNKKNASTRTPIKSKGRVKNFKR